MHSRESKVKMMSRTKARFTEEPYLTQKEPGEVTSAPDIPKSPLTLRTWKDKQAMGLVRASLWLSKLSMVEKGKAITTKLEEEEEDLQALIAQIEAQDEEEEMFPKSFRW